MLEKEETEKGINQNLTYVAFVSVFLKRKEAAGNEDRSGGIGKK